MTAPCTLTIDSLLLPVASEGEAARVAQCMTVELENLHARDSASGLAWRDTLSGLSLEVQDGLDAQATGRLLARSMRDRLVMHGDTP